MSLGPLSLYEAVVSFPTFWWHPFIIRQILAIHLLLDLSLDESRYTLQALCHLLILS